MRLWRNDGQCLRHLAGPVASFALDVPASAGARITPEGAVWLGKAVSLMPALSALLESDWHRARVGEELASRYEEIDLLYTITEILGSTVRLDEAAQVIVREVAGVVGARRASIMVHDAARNRLRTVAARGFTADDEYFVQVDDPESVAARVFRERRVVVHDPETSVPRHPVSDRPYRGQAYLSVPICYASQGGPLRCIGVINLTDRTGGDRFTPGFWESRIGDPVGRIPTDEVVLP